jgi:hypothetical protein
MGVWCAAFAGVKTPQLPKRARIWHPAGTVAMGALRPEGVAPPRPKGVSDLRQRLFGLVIASLVAAGGCGGTARQSVPPPAPAPANAAPRAQVAGEATYVDPAYTPDRKTLASLAIAPVPFAGEHAGEIDQGLERVFLDTPGCQLRGQPAYIRRAMNGNRAFLSQIERIRAVQYAPADLPQANLEQLMSAKEMIDLRSALMSASMFVVPTEFVVESGDHSTHGEVAYRVYSLESGRLLLQNRLETRLAQGGDAGQRQARIELLLAMQKDFADRLMP